MPNEGTEMMCMNLHFTKEHAVRCGINEDKGEVRSADDMRVHETAQWAANAIDIYQAITNKSLPMEVYQAFAIGYVLRGYDGILDFNLEEEEILMSVLNTLLTSNNKAMRDDVIARIRGDK